MDATTTSEDADNPDYDKKLLVLVQQHEFVYNPEKKLYKSVEAKAIAWNEIGSSLGKEGKVVKRRWITLRDRYRKYKRDLKLSELFPDIKPPAWHLYESIRFLDSIDLQSFKRARSTPALHELNESELDDKEAAILQKMKEEENIIEEEEESSEMLNEANIGLVLNEGLDRRLIALLKSHNILANNSRKSEMMKMRTMVWSQIAKSLHLDVKTCRYRWSYLRNRYSKECRMRKRDPENYKKSNWALFDPMDSLMKETRAQVAKNASMPNDVTSNNEDSLFLENEMSCKSNDDLNDYGNSMDTFSQASNTKGSIDLDLEAEVDNEIACETAANKSSLISSQSLDKFEVLIDDEEIGNFLRIIGNKLKSLQIKYKNKAMEDILQYCNARQNYQAKNSTQLPKIVMSCTECDTKHHSIYDSEEEEEDDYGDDVDDGDDEEHARKNIKLSK